METSPSKKEIEEEEIEEEPEEEYHLPSHKMSGKKVRYILSEDIGANSG